MGLLKDGRRNTASLTDSYKFTHWLQLPPGLTHLRAYMTARGTKMPGVTSVVSYLAANYYVEKLFSHRIQRSDLDTLRHRVKRHFFGQDYFNYNGWMKIVKEYNGFLPLRVRIAPEGSRVKLGDPVLFVENTDPELAWLTTYIEPIYMKMRYAADVATISDLAKQTVMKHLITTGTPGEIDYKVHDFGFRATGTDEEAIIGGSAHLVNFKGTDTFEALDFVNDYYGDDDAGHSILATEHSTAMAWPNEIDFYRHLINTIPPDVMFACVSDTNDIYRACRDMWGTELRDQVLARKAALVIRPDSGHAPTQIPELLDILTDRSRFGFTVNEKGYKVLPPQVRLISGDGHKIKHDLNTIDELYSALAAKGYSADNLAVGFGGGMLNGTTRDTFQWAAKECGVVINGVEYDRAKRPVDDPSKASRTYSSMRDQIEAMPIIYECAEKRMCIERDTWDRVRTRAAEFYAPATV